MRQYVLMDQGRASGQTFVKQSKALEDRLVFCLVGAPWNGLDSWNGWVEVKWARWGATYIHNPGSH